MDRNVNVKVDEWEHEGELYGFEGGVIYTEGPWDDATGPEWIRVSPYVNFLVAYDPESTAEVELDSIPLSLWPALRQRILDEANGEYGDFDS